MRRTRFLLVLSGFSITGAVVWVSGCGTTYRDCVEADDPDSLRICEVFLLANAGSGGGGGGGGGTPAGCVPSESAQPVGDDCGVFVSSSLGVDRNAGTRSAPVKTLQKAIDQAKGKPVYACAEAFSGSVTLSTGATIYGGLDCTKGWGYVGATKMSALMGDAAQVALMLEQSASGVVVEDFTIQAASATLPGGSSI